MRYSPILLCSFALHWLSSSPWHFSGPLESVLPKSSQETAEPGQFDMMIAIKRFVSSTATAPAPSLTSLVAKLRAETGQGYSLCREALQKASNDLDKARTILAALVAEQASKTQLKAAEKEKSQGLIGIKALNDKNVAVLELRCLSDFVARSQPVLHLGNQIFDALSKGGSALEINASGASNTVKELSKVMQIEEILNETVGKVKEPIEISHLSLLQCDESEVNGTYLHQPLDGSHFGSVAAFVALQCPPAFSGQPWTRSLADLIAKHVAGMKPDALDTLNQQPFLFNPDVSVSQLISDTALEKGATASSVSIKRFHRFALN